MKNIIYNIKGLIYNTGVNWDKLAPSEEEAIDFAHDYLNEDPPKRISNTLFSNEYCLAHSGESLNEHLRNDHITERDIEIANTFSGYNAKKDLVLYRGVCEYVYEQMIENAKSIEDADLYEKGYLYCSLVKGHELNYDTKLRIYVPAGTSAIYSGNVNDEQCFYEVIVYHGASLKIVSIDKEYINCKLVS